MSHFVVIGGGIAGVSAAAHLATHGSVTLLEMEDTLAYHTTGRSAALFVVNYGAEGIRPLAKASGPFLKSPPQGLTEAPLLSERGLLWIANHSQLEGLAATAREGEEAGAGSQLIDVDRVCELLPVVDRQVVAGGLFEPTARDIDVATLHQVFVRLARRHDTTIVTGAGVVGLKRLESGWRVMTESARYDCDVVVNAAGAWGDEVAKMAGLRPVGLQPMRRTAFMVPGHPDYSVWPMVVDADQRFYFKPDGVQLLCSLAEEEPSEPTDPRPRMEDIALAIERINRATTLGIRSVNSNWTGLRTFAPDREMVIGMEPDAPGFFWLVGQGGTGIQTAPACGALLAALATGGDLPVVLQSEGVDPAVTSPERFRSPSG